jgi:hypothetical protein
METIKIGNHSFSVSDFGNDYDYGDDSDDAQGPAQLNPMIQLLDKFNRDYPRMLGALDDFHSLVIYIDQIRYCVFALTGLIFVAVTLFLAMTWYYRRQNCQRWLQQSILAHQRGTISTQGPIVPIRNTENARLIPHVAPTEQEKYADGSVAVASQQNLTKFGTSNFPTEINSGLQEMKSDFEMDERGLSVVAKAERGAVAYEPQVTPLGSPRIGVRSPLRSPGSTGGRHRDIREDGTNCRWSERPLSRTEEENDHNSEAIERI